MTKTIPAKFTPQLATLTSLTPTSKDWIHEVKFDGYRIICLIKPHSVSLITRNGNDWSSKFPEIIDSFKNFPQRNTILDGELVILDKHGISQFQLLQNVLDDNDDYSLTYFVFDIPFYNGENITQASLTNRKKKLKSVFKEWKRPPKNIIETKYILGQGEKVYKAACRQGLEGIVSKNISSPYEQKRTKTWLKSKCIHRQEFVIGGFTKPRRSRKYFGALLIGYYDNKKFIYCGKVGTGFSEKTLAELYKRMRALIIEKCPFHGGSKIKNLAVTLWIKPKLVAELTFTEWTTDGLLRHPSFMGLRLDKKAIQVTKEA